MRQAVETGGDGRPLTRTVTYKGVEFALSEGPDTGPFFVLGVRKSGSSILNSLVKALADKNDLNFVDVAGTLFERGLAVSDWQTDEALASILAPGNVYGGW